MHLHPVLQYHHPSVVTLGQTSHPLPIGHLQRLPGPKAGTQFSAQGATSWGSRFVVRIKIWTRPKKLPFFWLLVWIFFGFPSIDEQQKEEKTLRASSNSHPIAKMAGSRFVVSVLLAHRGNEFNSTLAWPGPPTHPLQKWLFLVTKLLALCERLGVFEICEWLRQGWDQRVATAPTDQSDRDRWAQCIKGAPGWHFTQHRSRSRSRRRWPAAKRKASARSPRTPQWLTYFSSSCCCDGKRGYDYWYQATIGAYDGSSKHRGHEILPTDGTPKLSVNLLKFEKQKEHNQRMAIRPTWWECRNI